MDVSSLCSKAVGAITAGLVLYDAHKNGTITATRNAKTAVANHLVDEYVHTNKINKVSTVEVNAKKAWFRHVMDNNILEAITSAFGYVKGVCKSFVTDVIPAALATGALLLNKKGSKLCGLGLLAYGTKYLLYDVMSIGKRDYLKDSV
ncbi:hypothetical protein IJE86_01110 [bacterium]|nr:hypothetical protein [bacterium]